MTSDVIDHALVRRCIGAQKSVGFPEDDEPRVLSAAQIILAQNLAPTVWFANRDRVAQTAKENGIKLETFGARIQYADEAAQGIEGATAEHYRSYLAAKGKPTNDKVVQEFAASRLTQFGELLYSGRVDVVIAGAKATTAEVIRAAITTIGLAPGLRTVSGAFYFTHATKPSMLYADCGVVVSPAVRQLVDIGMAAVETWRVVEPNREPKVAFLSFSTHGSADDGAAEKMAEAARELATRLPSVKIDGELQFDAAIDPAIAARKAPGSAVAGDANIFIFPDLSAGNIAYKITQRLAGYTACGPILQGLAKPYSDLSRGSTVKDIVETTCVNILRAASMAAC